MQIGASTLFLRCPTSALRSPKSFVNAIMLAKAINKYASTAVSDKKQHALQAKPGAANVAPPHELKRKFDRSMSTTSSLGSLHQQSFSDENTPPADMIGLTGSSEKHSDIHYPVLDRAGAVSSPSIPPSPRGSSAVPASSAPVPWSPSPEDHFESAKPTRPTTEMQSPHAVSPIRKKRVFPASFHDKPSAASLEPPAAKQNLFNNDKPRNLATGAGVKQFQFVGGDKAAQAMSDMLQKSSFARQRLPASNSRSSSERTFDSLPERTETGMPNTKKVAELFLSDEQKAVMKAVMDEGRSVFFTGSAGTGKSVLMRAIISQLRQKHRKDPDRFAITASTGLASCILEGQTLHSWSGIGLGKEPAPELVKKIKRNRKSRDRWLRTKVLIIDEVSMVDGQLFDKLEQIARTIRNNGRPFGGIQLVVTGDFFQLPPVPEKNTQSKFVFEAVTWNTCVQHTILLTHVFRQKDESFARMLNEMRLGKMTPATVREFKSLSRPLNFHDDLEATEL